MSTQTKTKTISFRRFDKQLKRLNLICQFLAGGVTQDELVIAVNTRLGVNYSKNTIQSDLYMLINRLGCPVESSGWPLRYRLYDAFMLSEQVDKLVRGKVIETKYIEKQSPSIEIAKQNGGNRNQSRKTGRKKMTKNQTIKQLQAKAEKLEKQIEELQQQRDSGKLNHKQWLQTQSSINALNHDLHVTNQKRKNVAANKPILGEHSPENDID